jgi:Fuc2NAc and GlcNAc transferase
MGRSILIFLLGLFSGIAGSFLVYRYGPQLSFIDMPNQRSSHSEPTPRGGGAGILAALIITATFIFNDMIFTALAGAVGLLGFLDDRFTISSNMRLLFQMLISATAVVLFLGLPISLGALMLFLFYVVFITGTANFYNFMDGINGIAGLTGVIGFGLLAFFSSFIANNTEIALLSICLSAGCLGFLPFNFPKAKVFMGDVGSILLGFVFAFFVVKLSVNTRGFICLIMFLCMFYADALVTIFYRWRKGENLLKAHRGHLYQYMSNEMAMPHWKVATIYAIMQLIFGFLALLAYRQGFMWQLTVSGGFAVMFFVTYKIIKNIDPLMATARTDI